MYSLTRFGTHHSSTILIWLYLATGVTFRSYDNSELAIPMPTTRSGKNSNNIDESFARRGIRAVTSYFRTNDSSGDSDILEINLSDSENSSEEEEHVPTPKSLRNRHKMTDREKDVVSSSKATVFIGKNYKQWRWQLMSIIDEYEIEEILEPSEEEIAFIKYTKAERRRVLPEYTRKQKIARAIISERLGPDYIEKVEECSTIRQMLEILDREFITTSKIGLLDLRERYITFKFKEGGDLRKFIDLHEKRMREYETAGAKQSEDDRIMNLHRAIPPRFDSVLYYLYGAASLTQNYQTYRVLILENYERTQSMAGKPLTEFTDTRKGTGKRGEQSNAEVSKPAGNQKTCFYCKEYGHFIRNCPKLAAKSEMMEKLSQPSSSKLKESGYNQSTTTEKKTKEEEKPTPPDWTKFVNFKPKTMNIVLSDAAKLILQNIDDQEESEESSTEENHEYVSESAVDVRVKNKQEPFIEFLIDSGSQCHVVNELSRLLDIHKVENFEMTCANVNAPIVATHYGRLLVETETGMRIEFAPVFYVPEIPCNVLSVSRITRTREFGVDFYRPIVDVYERDTRTIVFSGYEVDDLMYVTFRRISEDGTTGLHRPLIMATPEVVPKVQQQILNWHSKLAHASAKYIRAAFSNLDNIQPIKFDDKLLRGCEICCKAKSSRLPHNTQRKRSTRAFHTIATDIYDFGELSQEGRKLAVTFTDTFSGYIKIRPIKSKSDVADQFAHYVKEIEAKYSTKVAMLRSDCAKEYISGDLEVFCAAASIEIDPGIPYSPELNGLSERKNKDINIKTKALLYEARLPTKYWELAAAVTQYVMNRLATKTNNEFLTPFEIVKGYKPDARTFHKFGCTAMVHVPIQVREREAGKLRRRANSLGMATVPGSVQGSKLAPSAEKLVFVGYTKTGYKFLNPVTNTITLSRDVTHWYEDERAEDIWPDINKPVLPPPGRTPKNMAETPKKTTEPDHTYAKTPKVTLLSAQHQLLTLISDNIPANYTAALNSQFAEHWVNAMTDEFQSHIQNGTWHLVIHPGRGKNILNTKWVYTVKFDIDGTEIAKARLVAIGCGDRNQYVEEAIYTPVCPSDVIRLLISMAQAYSWSLTAMDVTTAFLYGHLEEEIYLRIPEGIELDRKQYALRLDKSIYGLKVSSRCWFETLREVIADIGFVPTEAERCLFIYKSEENVALLAVYADDMLLSANSGTLRLSIIEKFRKRFQIKVAENPTKFLGMQIDRAENKIRIHQALYIKKMTERLNLQNMSPVSLPMEPHLRIPKSEVPNDDREFRRLVGIILYVARFSRPDVTYAVNSLARHQGKVTPEVKSYAKRVLKYLYDTRNFVIEYTAPDERPLRAFCDASFAPDVPYEKDMPGDVEASTYSQTGLAVFHHGNLINWGSSKQTIVATSSTAAEVIAVCESLDAVLIPRDILQEVIGPQLPILLYEDNSSAARMLVGCQNKRMRHVMIKAGAVQQAVRDGEIALINVEGDQQIADMLTKALPSDRFETLRKYLLVEVKDMLEENNESR